MNRRSDKLIRDKILEEEHRGNRSQAKQCHRSRNEQRDIDSGSLDGLRGDNARSLVECFLAYMTSVSPGSFQDANQILKQIAITMAEKSNRLNHSIDS